MVLPVHLLVLAKQPLPGRVKTRLTPPLSPAQAADVARAALLDTLSTVAAVPVARRTVVLDGSPLGWLPGGFAVLPQSDGDLAARLERAFSDAHTALPSPMLLVGMDTPQVTARQLEEAVTLLLRPGTPAVLGLAEDGGWWALGLHRPVPGAFEGVPMSTDRAGVAQQARLTALGLPPVLLPTARDIDGVEDLWAVVALMPPGAHLARVAGGLRAGAA